jgi:colicin import membrane protein
MRIQRDFYTEAKRPSRGLRRGTIVSIVVHTLLLGAISGAAYYMKSAPPLNVIDVGVMFAGLPDAPEGGESTRVANLPPGIPESKPAAPKKQPAEKKPEPPKEEAKPPEPEKPPVEEKKPEPKKPDPVKDKEKVPVIAPKEEPKKEEPPKEKEPEKKPEKDVKKFKKGDTLPDTGADDMLEAELEQQASLSTPGTPGAGGLEGARVSDKAQTFLGDPQADESGISVRGMPSILGSWANSVKRAVKGQWREPGGMPLGSRTAVSFWVSADGQLLGEPEVVEPSNDASLDQSAVNAVKLAAPFMPLPANYHEPKQQVIFVFTISS